MDSLCIDFFGYQLNVIISLLVFSSVLLISVIIETTKTIKESKVKRRRGEYISGISLNSKSNMNYEFILLHDASNIIPHFTEESKYIGEDNGSHS